MIRFEGITFVCDGCGRELHFQKEAFEGLYYQQWAFRRIANNQRTLCCGDCSDELDYYFDAHVDKEKAIDLSDLPAVAKRLAAREEAKNDN